MAFINVVKWSAESVVVWLKGTCVCLTDCPPLICMASALATLAFMCEREDVEMRNVWRTFLFLIIFFSLSRSAAYTTTLALHTPFVASRILDPPIADR